MKSWQGILGWVMAAVFAVLYFQKCGHDCPKCPESKQITGDSTYVPNQEPVKPDTASYVPEQKPVKAEQKLAKQKQADLYFTDEYHKRTEVPYYEPLQAPAAPASDYFYPSSAIPDTVLRSIMDIIPCPLQTSTDTQRIADKGYVVIKDLIRGSIISRTFSYNISAATPAQEHGGNKPRARWYAGIEAVGARQEWIRYAGVSIGYQPKKGKALITLGGGYIMRQPAVKVGIYTQLNRNR